MKENRIFLANASIALFLLYFAYDIPAAINTSIQFQGKSATQQQLSYLYAAYALPNIICPLIFGAIYAYIKHNLLFIILFCIFSGQALFTQGMFKENIKTAICGRILFGMGLESYFVYANNKISQYFIGKKLAVSMSMFLAIGRMGTVTTFFINPILLIKYSVNTIHVVGFGLTGLAMLFILLLYIFPGTEAENIEEHAINQTNKKHALFILLQIIFLFACIWAPFYNLAPIMFQKRFGFDKIHSSRFLCYIEGSSIFLGLIIGYYVDYYGKKLYFVLTSAILITVAHSIFLFKYATVNFSIGFLALAAAMMACYWPCIPKIITEEYLAINFSGIVCIVNAAYTISPLVAAFLLKYNAIYTYTEEYMFVLSFILIYKIITLIQYNAKHNLQLNAPEIVNKKEN